MTELLAATIYKMLKIEIKKNLDMRLWNMDAPGSNKVKIWQKISKCYILTPLTPRGMGCQWSGGTHRWTYSQVWLLYHHPSFKYCTLFVSGMELQTDRRTNVNLYQLKVYNFFKKANKRPKGSSISTWVPFESLTTEWNQKQQFFLHNSKTFGRRHWALASSQVSTKSFQLLQARSTCITKCVCETPINPAAKYPKNNFSV